MCRDLVEGGSGDVDPAHDEVGADVALVPEEHLLHHPLGGHHPHLPVQYRSVQDTVQYSTPPHLPPRVESVQLQLARDGARGLVAVRGRARTRAVNIRRHEVELLAILVGHNISSCGPGRI